MRPAAIFHGETERRPGQIERKDEPRENSDVQIWSANRVFQRCCKKRQRMTWRGTVSSALADAKGRLAINIETSTLVLTLHVQ